MDDKKIKSGFFNSWRNVYLCVIGFLVVTIIFLFYITNNFK